MPRGGDTDGEEPDGARPRDVRGRDGHDGSGEERADREGKGFEPGRQEVAGGKAGGEDDARGPLAGNPGDGGEATHEGDQRESPQEGTDVERRRHARVSEAEAGGDDDAEDRAWEGPVGDGFGEKDTPVQVGEGADEPAQPANERDVEGGNHEEAEDHDASPTASVAAPHVSRPVSRGSTAP